MKAVWKEKNSYGETLHFNLKYVYLVVRGRQIKTINGKIRPEKYELNKMENFLKLKTLTLGNWKTVRQFVFRLSEVMLFVFVLWTIVVGKLVPADAALLSDNHALHILHDRRFFLLSHKIAERFSAAELWQ